MRDFSIPGRLLDLGILATVLVLVGVAATASRAERAAAPVVATIVAAAPVCANAGQAHRDACLAAARAVAITR